MKYSAGRHKAQQSSKKCLKREVAKQLGPGMGLAYMQPTVLCSTIHRVAMPALWSGLTLVNVACCRTSALVRTLAGRNQTAMKSEGARRVAWLAMPPVPLGLAVTRCHAAAGETQYCPLQSAASALKEGGSGAVSYQNGP